MKLPIFELIQRAENGGSPLDNETAHDLGIGHGTPVVVMPMRKLIALLKRAKSTAGSVQIDYDLYNGIEEFLKANDQFVVEVEPDELFRDDS